MTIGAVGGGSNTALGAVIRELQSAIEQQAGQNESARVELGTIFDVHAEKPMIRCYDDDGHTISDGKYIDKSWGS